MIQGKKSTRLHLNQQGLGEREWNEKIIITERDYAAEGQRPSGLISSKFENRSVQGTR